MLANNCNVGAETFLTKNIVATIHFKNHWPLSPSSNSILFVTSVSSKFAADCSSWMDFLLYVECRWFADWGMCKGFLSVPTPFNHVPDFVHIYANKEVFCLYTLWVNPKSQFYLFRKGFKYSFHVITIVSNLLDYSVKAEILNSKKRSVCDPMLYVQIKEGY